MDALVQGHTLQYAGELGIGPFQPSSAAAGSLVRSQRFTTQVPGAGGNRGVAALDQWCRLSCAGSELGLVSLEGGRFGEGC
ncbi:MAG TPA: hypothetical protein VM537_16325 [Anaerolineae bacterium]|nr:hypothetical protein [Anaerolineae bacterium]